MPRRAIFRHRGHLRAAVEVGERGALLAGRGIALHPLPQHVHRRAVPRVL